MYPIVVDVAANESIIFNVPLFTTAAFTVPDSSAAEYLNECPCMSNVMLVPDGIVTGDVITTSFKNIIVPSLLAELFITFIPAATDE